MTNQTRVSAGVPTGGQFAAQDRAEDTVTLVDAFRANQRAAHDLVHHNQRLATTILARMLLAERPDARYLTISEGEEGGYWNNGGTLLDADEQELIETDELDCADAIYDFVDLPLYAPTVWGEDAPAPGFEWLTMTPGNHREYATATIDLQAAAAQEL